MKVPKESPEVRKARRKAEALKKKEAKLSSENEQKWELFFKKSKGIKPSVFDIAKKFEPKTPIEHPSFGWGWIMNRANDRLEVIFKDKVRLLISNQASRQQMANNKANKTK